MRYVLLSSCSGTVEVMQMMKLVWMVTVLVIAAPPDCAHGQTSEYQTKAEREERILIEVWIISVTALLKCTLVAINYEGRR